MKGLWCDFSDEEVFTIKKALRGSLLVGLSNGVGDNYQNYLENFSETVNTVAPSSNEECEEVRFLQTPYLHDAVEIAATALDGLIKFKSHEENTVQVTQSDHDLLVDQLLSAEVPDGFTGRLGFTDKGKRKVASFAINNFVPIKNSDFNVSTAVAENPWVLETRGVLRKEGNNVSIVFFTSDGKESNVSTIIFADGTSNIPLYRPYRIYRRGKQSKMSGVDAF